MAAEGLEGACSRVNHHAEPRYCGSIQDTASTVANTVESFHLKLRSAPPVSESRCALTATFALSTGACADLTVAYLAN